MCAVEGTDDEVFADRLDISLRICFSESDVCSISFSIRRSAVFVLSFDLLSLSCLEQMLSIQAFIPATRCEVQALEGFENGPSADSSQRFELLATKCR